MRPSEIETSSPNVAIVLGYYNGQKYLAEQLHSILNQSYRNIEIFVFDDGSEVPIDLEALELAIDDISRVHLTVRPSNVGYSRNFLLGLNETDCEFDYYAFSDQDDVWHHDKIANALTLLEQPPKDRPTLYCARTKITDENCEILLGHSPLFKDEPSFANALVQNIGGGNTMVFNRLTKDLVVESTKEVNVVSHDWWCYQIVSGIGGWVHYDPKPCLRYRQHASNLFGTNTGWAARRIRIADLLAGRFRSWNDVNSAALLKNKNLLLKKNQARVEAFVERRHSGLFKRLSLYERVIKRQTRFGRLSLFLGLMIKKV